MRINVGSHYLNVDVQGTGWPVVLHPTISRPSDDLKPLSDDLVNAGYQTVIINPRGISGSTGKTKDVTMKELAGDIAAVIKALNLGPSHVIGHNSATSFVRVLAEYWPELVSSLVLITCSGVIPSQINPIYAFEPILNIRRGDDPQFQEAVKKVFFAESSDSSPWFNARYDDHLVGVFVDLFEGAMSTAPQYEWLGGGKAPMLIAQGLEDKIAPPASGYILKNMFGDRIEVVDIPNAGHYIIHEQPKLISEAILTFLDRQKENKGGRTEKNDSERMSSSSAKDSTAGKSNYDFEWDATLRKHKLSFPLSEAGGHFLQKITKGMRILSCDFGGCSATLELADYAANCHVIGIDARQNDIESATVTAEKRKAFNVEFIKADMHALPFKEGAFDAVWLSTIALNMEGSMRTLREIRRVLVPGGVIAISDYDCKNDLLYPVIPAIMQEMAELGRQRHTGEVGDRRAGFARSLLRQAGFKNVDGYAVAESYGTPERRRLFSDFILEFMMRYRQGKKSEISFRILENAWKTWADQHDAFFSRVHYQATGFK